MPRLRKRGSVDESPPTGGTWLAWPTLSEANVLRPIVGTSHYQDAIERAAEGRTTAGPNVRLVMAELREVASGTFAGAIEVLLGGYVVGHLPSEMGVPYGPVVQSLVGDGQPATCRAEIVGGHYQEDERSWRNFVLWLLQPRNPKRFAQGEPFLPPRSGTPVELLSGNDEYLDGLINSKAKAKRVATTGRLVERDQEWLLWIGDQEVGFPLLGSAEAASSLRAALDAGFPLTCQARVIREPGKTTRVAVDLP